MDTLRFVPGQKVKIKDTNQTGTIVWGIIKVGKYKIEWEHGGVKHEGFAQEEDLEAT